MKSLLLVIVFTITFYRLQAQDKPTIAVFSGPTATIQNSEPLITSNKARHKYGLPSLLDQEGDTLMDRLFMQRLAAPVTLYVKMFSAHPLEKDAKELYASADGYVDASGSFHKEPTSNDDVPVYEVTLTPEDGLYPLPYMGRQSDGKPWNAEYAYSGAPFEQSRQTFYPDGSRIFEEIERKGGRIYEKASYDFYRPAPSGGYTQGLDADQRTDVGDGDIAPEVIGEDFFTYGPYGSSPNRTVLARATNVVQEAMNSGKYEGGIWLEGSPSIENTSYWMSLLIDTDKPLVFNAAQRKRKSLSADGDRNIIDAIDYITSGVWKSEEGKNLAGSSLIQAQTIYAVREVQKADARPGGYEVTGGHGGVMGTLGYGAKMTYLPSRKHTYLSEVNTTRIPEKVDGVCLINGMVSQTAVKIKNAEGALLPEAIPMVVIYKSSRWRGENDAESDASTEVDILARIEDNLKHYPLAGIVGEGLAPYGSMTAPMEAALEKAVLQGYPVLKAARGNAGGFMDTNEQNLFIEGQNITATKGRILLMACIMRFGALPPVEDVTNPTAAELSAIKDKIALYQEVFNTH
ncbi:asparaginase domain-containing protein [Catalinimonas sp. 4WD22]|uniref:asparaginase domain-containing protein n=1 Tax=Catalinimonas locisalis TaxID=3133978 RepID=UPI003101B0CD